MKPEKMFVTFTLLLSVFFFSSCSDDDNYEPITLISPDSTITVENGFANLYLTPLGNSLSLYIQGGDGQYVIENTDKDVVTVNYDGKTLVVKPTAVGYTSIQIHDHSKNSLIVYINVDYRKMSYKVIQCFSYVVGDDLTIKEKKQLEEEIVADMPVAAGGRYEFTYNAPEGGPKGEVNIYPNRNSKKLKGTFIVEDHETEEGYRYNQFTIRVNEKEWVFADVPYFNPNTRFAGGDYMQPLMLVEDVTENYKQQYPALEKAYAFQAYMQ